MSDSSNQERFGGRWFIPAAVVVALVIILVIVLSIANLLGGSKSTSPASTPHPSQTTAATVPASAQSVCGLKGYETTNTLTAAPKTTWQLVGTAAAPTDKKGAGPGVVAPDGFRSCYAHNSAGALFAAANFAVLGTDATLYQQMPALVLPGPGKDAITKKEQANGGSPSTGSPRAQIAGFKIDSYSATNATVDLALNYSDGTIASAPLKLEWSEQDWKIVLTDNGSFPLPPIQLQNLGGYTPWSGA